MSALSKRTMIMHWMVAILMIWLIGIGIYMSENHVYPLYDLHKSVGVIAFGLILARVVWRLKEGFPTPVSQYKKHEIMLSKVVHWTLLIGTILMPISGMVMSGAGGHGISVFGFELFAANPDPMNAHKVLPFNESLAKAGNAMHGTIAWVMVIAIVLHVAGALKHHLVDKDRTLLRMLGK